MTGLQEHYPDPNRAAVGDIQTRNVYLRDQLSVSTASSRTIRLDAPLRIRSVWVAADTGGTYTIQLQVDGRDLFANASRPISGAGPSEPNNVYILFATTPLTVAVEATTGAPAANAKVTIETEPYILVPRTPQVEPHGANRKRPSTRAAIKRFNATGSLVPAVVTQRVVGTPSPRVLPIGEPLGYRPREVIP